MPNVEVVLLDLPTALVAERWHELCQVEPVLGAGFPIFAAPEFADTFCGALQLDRPGPGSYDDVLQEASVEFAKSCRTWMLAHRAVNVLAYVVSSLLPDCGRDERAELDRRILLSAGEAAVAMTGAGFAEIDRSAHRDGLTALLNRRAFDRDLFAAIEAGACAVVSLDLNGLKIVNDSGGHEAGDALIRSMAEALANIGDERWSAYRFGGDEFALLIRDSAVSDAEVRNQLELARSSELSFSYGLARHPQDGESGNAVWAVADERMYECKRRQRSVRDGYVRVAKELRGLSRTIIIRSALKLDVVRGFARSFVSPEGAPDRSRGSQQA